VTRNRLDNSALVVFGVKFSTEPISTLLSKGVRKGEFLG